MLGCQCDKVELTIVPKFIFEKLYLKYIMIMAKSKIFLTAFILTKK